VIRELLLSFKVLAGLLLLTPLLLFRMLTVKLKCGLRQLYEKTRNEIPTAHSGETRQSD